MRFFLVPLPWYHLPFRSRTAFASLSYSVVNPSAQDSLPRLAALLPFILLEDGSKIQPTKGQLRMDLFCFLSVLSLNLNPHSTLLTEFSPYPFLVWWWGWLVSLQYWDYRHEIPWCYAIDDMWQIYINNMEKKDYFSISDSCYLSAP